MLEYGKFIHNFRSITPNGVPMTRAYAARMEQLGGESGKYVLISAKQRAQLDRLKKAYGMTRRMDVLNYLIEQGVKGLEAAVEGGRG